MGKWLTRICIVIIVTVELMSCATTGHAASREHTITEIADCSHYRGNVFMCVDQHGDEVLVATHGAAPMTGKVIPLGKGKYQIVRSGERVRIKPL